MASSIHIPVLVQEILEGLQIISSDVVLDGTINGGGHAEAFCQQLGERGTLIGLDVDQSGLDRSHDRLKGYLCTKHLIKRNFSDVVRVLDELGITSVDKALFDLGWSSDQFENSERGFSLQHDGPLRMTLDNTPTDDMVTAHDVVNTWQEETLVDILRGFADERYAPRIASAIVKRRQEAPIETTRELADLVSDALPKRLGYKKIHPATKTFQAIRMAVNSELDVIKMGLTSLIPRMTRGGRIAVITFHSIEDRVVKHLFREEADQGTIALINKRVIVPTRDEVQSNPRARSAKLRIIEKL